MRDFHENNRSIFSGKKIFVIATMGLFSGDGTGCAARLLKNMVLKLFVVYILKCPIVLAMKSYLKRHKKKIESLLNRLAWGLVALAIHESNRFKQWQKTLLILGIIAIAFCSDWSSIAVLAIVQIGANRGKFKKKMTIMMLWVAVYAVVYAVFINPVYGVLQLFVALSIPLLKRYSGQQGTWKGMKWFFYVYYPQHLIICGLIRIALFGNIGVMIGNNG